MKKLALVLWASLMTALPIGAQNNITLFGDGPPALGYVTRSKRPGARLNSLKLFAGLPNKAVAEIQLFYAEGMGGIFQEDSIVVLDRRSGKKKEVREIRVDRQIRSVRLVFTEPIAAIPGQELEIRISGITNPRDSGIYQVNVQALGTEANPLFQSLGRWLIDIY